MKFTIIIYNCKMECKYCLSDDNKDNLIYPCKCSGSIKYVHYDCLRRWIEEKNIYNCELCKYYYVMDYTNSNIDYCCIMMIMLFFLVNYTITGLTFYKYNIGNYFMRTRQIPTMFGIVITGSYYFSIILGVIVISPVMLIVDCKGDECIFYVYLSIFIGIVTSIYLSHRMYRRMQYFRINDVRITKIYNYRS